jgi:hypothetical protein
MGDSSAPPSREVWTPTPAQAPIPSPALLRSLAIVARIAAVILVVLGAAVLVGWALDVGWLEDPLHGFPPMVPNIAVMFALGGAALWLAGPNGASRRRVWAARALAAGCGTLALATAAACPGSSSGSTSATASSRRSAATSGSRASPGRRRISASRSRARRARTGSARSGIRSRVAEDLAWLLLLPIGALLIIASTAAVFDVAGPRREKGA